MNHTTAKRVKFVSRDNPREKFYPVLRGRVKDYFEENNLSRHHNPQMILKSIIMLSLYFVPYGLIMSNSFPLWQMWIMAAIMGVGLAGIGLSIMHDANHGAYSKSKQVNQLMGFTLNLIGGCAKTWQVNHNVIHHTFTHIPGYDEEIRDRKIVRLSPLAKWRPMHRYQHIYAFFLYGFQTIIWVLYKDFIQLKEYVEQGYIQEAKKELGILILSRVVYYTYMVALPFMFVDMTIGQFLIGFFTMHYLAGMILTIVLAMGHMVEETDLPMPNEHDTIENKWAIHQVQTTSNFGNGSRFLNWYTGGLNFQIEHHLFPKVCHIHYPQISKIVMATIEEFDLPYYHHETLWKAIGSHKKHLKELGDPNYVVVPAKESLEKVAVPG